jgi:carboxylesterase
MLRGRAALPRLRAPTLVIQSRDDNRIDRDAAEEAFALIGTSAKQFVWTQGSGHVITVDIGRDRVLSLTGQWLLDHMQRKRLTADAGYPPS